MLVSEILDEVKEAIGKCGDTFAIRTITRAVQLLANKGLIDPLVGYFDFSVADDYFVALPREVKTPLRVNINLQPTFSRSRIYEFHINSLGTQNHEEPGLSWSDRGYSPIQNEKALPGQLGYQVTSESDVGKTITVTGLDDNGRTVTDTITGTLDGAINGTHVFHRIERIKRQPTDSETFLLCNGANIVGQYYGDELTPEYRVIKLSKAASSVRVMFRRHVFKLTTVDDFIPMHSELAVIQACKAVRFLATDEFDKATAALTMAENFLKEEQASREEHNTIADNQEIQPAIDADIHVRDSIVVSDVYDAAADIFGPIGKSALFDKITTAIEILSNRGQWDARLGWVDVISPDNRHEVTYGTPQNVLTGNGHGYFVLPRHVEIPIAISTSCGNQMPRNRWFEFHLNGDGYMNDRSDGGMWDDAGDTCIIRKWPLNPNDPPSKRRALPLQFVAVPDSAVDDKTEVRIYGFERDDHGQDIEVWRGGERGWLCPCIKANRDPGVHAPFFTSIDRISKGESKSLIRLYSVEKKLISEEIPAIPGTPGTPGIPDIPEVPESDVTTLLGLPALVDLLTISSQTIVEPGPQSLTGWLYLRQNNSDNLQELEIRNADDGAGGLVMASVSFDASGGNQDMLVLAAADLSGTPWGTATSFGIVISGFASITDTYNGTLDPNSEIRFTRVYTPFSPAIPGVPEVPAIPGTPAIPAVYAWTEIDMFGMWYPDELEPLYRAIKLPHSAPKRIRVAYRKRTPKISSLTEPIPLRSRFAIEQQMRALKSANDPQAAAAFEAAALGYLRDERINQGPQGVSGMFQFDESTCPGFTGNVQ